MNYSNTPLGGSFASAHTQNALPPVEISQDAYSMLLLERSARQLAAGKYLQATGAPERKLSHKDFMSSFKKTATEFKLAMDNFDMPVTQFLINAVRKKYSIDIHAYTGMKIRDMAVHLASNNFRIGEKNANERRKTIVSNTDGASVA